MSSEFKRTDRVAHTMQRELAQIIQKEITDPAISGLTTLSAVTISNDLKRASVYFTVLGGDPKHTAERLNKASPFLKTLLAKRMKLRVTPQLHFVYDESIEYGMQLDRLIKKANPTPHDDIEQND